MIPARAATIASGRSPRASTRSCASSLQSAVQPTGEAAVPANLARIWHKLGEQE
jgi:hypothetical protein